MLMIIPRKALKPNPRLTQLVSVMDIREKGLDSSVPNGITRHLSKKEVCVLSISKTRGVLYKLARILGDVQAVSSGKPSKVAKRAGRRIVGKSTGRAMRKLFK